MTATRPQTPHHALPLQKDGRWQYGDDREQVQVGVPTGSSQVPGPGEGGKAWVAPALRSGCRGFWGSCLKEGWPPRPRTLAPSVEGTGLLQSKPTARAAPTVGSLGEGTWQPHLCTACLLGTARLTCDRKKVHWQVWDPPQALRTATCTLPTGSC